MEPPRAHAPPPIADALIRVPRHAFIPAAAWVEPAAGDGYWIDRDRDPDRWWRAVCTDTVIYTQLDDGATELTPHNAARAFAPTCSASSPLLIAAFLRHLAPAPGDRILEVGTGTGWTAALLADLTGDPGRVTTVEIDPALAATAAAALRAAGPPPRLVVGDGTHGVPEHAPFDRLHITAGVREIPYAWIKQTRPGGVIVLPYAPVMRLLRLVVAGDGTALGTFHEDCAFMLLRSQRPPAPPAATAPGPDRVRALERDPAPLLDPPPGLQLLFDVLIGDLPWEDRTGALVLDAAGSRATVREGRVIQRGPRDLWDEAERVHAVWTDRGAPGPDRMGLRLTRERQYVWLDDPAFAVADILTTRGETEHG